MEYRLFLLFVISFFITYFSTKLWIKIAKREKLTVKDMNKYEKPLIPSFGGITVIASFMFTTLLYVGISIFYYKRTIHLVEIFAILTTLLIISFIGMLDDIICGWKRVLNNGKNHF